MPRLTRGLPVPVEGLLMLRCWTRRWTDQTLYGLRGCRGGIWLLHAGCTAQHPARPYPARRCMSAPARSRLGHRGVELEVGGAGPAVEVQQAGTRRAQGEQVAHRVVVEGPGEGDPEQDDLEVGRRLPRAFRQVGEPGSVVDRGGSSAWPTRRPRSATSAPAGDRPPRRRRTASRERPPRCRSAAPRAAPGRGGSRRPRAPRRRLTGGAGGGVQPTSSAWWRARVRRRRGPRAGRPGPPRGTPRGWRAGRADGRSTSGTWPRRRPPRRRSRRGARHPM